MIILLTVIAVVITGVPLAAVALVTLASRREETARSIAGRAPGALERAARRLLAFHATGIGHPPGRVSARHEGWDPGHPPQDVRVPADRTAPALAGTAPALASSTAQALADPVPATPVPATPVPANPAPPDDLALAT
jgi:hypothetical protein